MMFSNKHNLTIILVTYTHLLVNLIFMKVKEIKKKFIDYFTKNDHQYLPSSLLSKTSDPTLLFVNSGMIPFREYFLFPLKAPYSRITTIQKCLRAGGKHNDINEIGHSNFHHTFFEMCGNFSFGDYGKERAIYFSYDFLINQLKLEKNKIKISLYPEDKEAKNIWQKYLQLNDEQFFYDPNNFWSAGNTGPCGYCTEIYYDIGKAIIEIWNIVLINANRDETGIHQLPYQSIDTGMGLERIATVLQGVSSNYDTDILFSIKELIRKKILVKESQLNLLVDHGRAISFLLSENIFPSNEGQGYIMRKLMRKIITIQHTHALKYSLLQDIVTSVSKIMLTDYPELKDLNFEVLAKEELDWKVNAAKNYKLFYSFIDRKKKKLLGDKIFFLYDTHGMNIEEIEQLAEQENIQLDYQKFNELLAQQKSLSQISHKNPIIDSIVNNLESIFLGYHQLENTSELIEIYNEKKEKVNQLFT